MIIDLKQNSSQAGQQFLRYMKPRCIHCQEIHFHHSCIINSNGTKSYGLRACTHLVEQIIQILYTNTLQRIAYGALILQTASTHEGFVGYARILLSLRDCSNIFPELIKPRAMQIVQMLTVYSGSKPLHQKVAMLSKGVCLFFRGGITLIKSPRIGTNTLIVTFFSMMLRPGTAKKRGTC